MYIKPYVITIGIILQAFVYSPSFSQSWFTQPTASFIQSPTETISDLVFYNQTIDSVQKAISKTRQQYPSNLIRITLSGQYNFTNSPLKLGSQMMLFLNNATLKSQAGANISSIIEVTNSQYITISGTGTAVINGGNQSIIGINVSNSGKVHVDGISFQDCKNGAVLYQGKGDNVYADAGSVTRCTISNCDSFGIQFTNATHFVCTDNTIQNCLTAINVDGNAAGVANNTIKSCKTGIRSYAQYEAIVYNIVQQCDSAMVLSSTSLETLVANNTFTNNSIGIHANGSKARIYNNTCQNTIPITGAGTGNQLFCNNGIAYASGNNSGCTYFDPPLIGNQHSNNIKQGKSRYDITITDTSLLAIRSIVDNAHTAKPTAVVVIHLNGTFKTNSTTDSLLILDNECYLLNGSILCNNACNAAIYCKGNVLSSFSGGTINGNAVGGKSALIYVTGNGSLVLDSIQVINSANEGITKRSSFGATFLRGCTISNSLSRNVWFLGSSRLFAFENTSNNAYYDGFDFDAFSSIGVLVKNKATSNRRHGVFIEEGAQQHLILGNTFNANNNGVSFYNLAVNNTNTAKNLVAYNICNANQRGMNINASSPSKATIDNTLFNNSCTNNTDVGMGGYYSGTNAYGNYTAFTYFQNNTNGAFFSSINYTLNFFWNMIANTALLPEAPTAVVATAGNAQATIAFSAISTSSAPTTSFTVTANPGGATASGTASPIILNGLNNGTAYTFTVTATNSVGTGAASIASNTITPFGETIWNGTSWSNGLPNSGIDGLIKGNLTTASALAYKNLTIETGFVYNSSASISVYGASLANNGTIEGTGTLYLSGTVLQTISGIGIVTNLSINNSSNVSVATSNTILNVSGVLTLAMGTLITNGNVVLKSISLTKSGTVAAIGVNGNNGSINGTVTVERFIPKGYRAWRDLAPSVYNAGNIFSNWQEAGSYTKPGYGIFITGITTKTNAHAIDATTGLDQSINSVPSIYTYATGNWSAITNTKATNLNPFLGYRILIRGDRTFNLLTTPIATIGTSGSMLMVNATAIRSTGQLITGNVVYNTSGITNSVAGTTYNNVVYGLNGITASGFSSIANPYVAPLDWKHIWDNNRAINLTANYYYLDPTIGSTGAYVSYNAIADVASNGVAGTRYIQAGQAFFIQNNNSTQPSLTITEADKAITATKTAVFGSITPRERLSISLQKLDGVEWKKVDMVTVVFDSTFSNNIGKEDAPKMTNPEENIAVANKNQLLSIEGRKPAKNNDTIPLNLNKLVANRYRLTIDASLYPAEKMEVSLLDTYDKKETVLNKELNIINIYVNVADKASYANRFCLVFKAANACTFFAASMIKAYTKRIVANTFNTKTVNEPLSIHYSTIKYLP